MENSKQPIKSYRDLIVYQDLYQAMVIVLTKIVPFLPKEEKYDLGDQLSRCCKAGPALIAEGFAKRYQKRLWRKYLDDAIGESNEMIHHLSVCIDVYHRYVDISLCKNLQETYDITCKRLTKLKQHWQNYHDKGTE